MLKIKEQISSRQNPTIKRICALLDKRSRREERLFRFDGIKLFCEAMECGLDVKYVVLLDRSIDRYGEIIERAIAKRDVQTPAVIAVNESVFSKLSDERSPEGIVTVASFIDEKHTVHTRAESLCVGSDERLLIAESLRDPGNLGTVIRSCAALGIDRLLLSDDCADLYNPKTIRAAMGGLFRLHIDILPLADMPRAIKMLRDTSRRVYAAALEDNACPIGELDLGARDCFVIGNEGHGLSSSVTEACDACAVIPMQSGCESLNAAAAATICIWETVSAK